MMRTNVADTSLEIYFGEVIHRLHSEHKHILDIFFENPTMDFTNSELQHELEQHDIYRPINMVTPRVYELRGLDKRYPLKAPMLVLHINRICRQTGKKAHAWQINPDAPAGIMRLGAKP